MVARAGLICVHGSDGRDLIMAPSAAIELVMAILHELGGRLIPPGGAGPISGSF